MWSSIQSGIDLPSYVLTGQKNLSCGSLACVSTYPRVVYFRVFALTHALDEALARAAEKALGSLAGQSKTNI